MTKTDAKPPQAGLTSHVASITLSAQGGAKSELEQAEIEYWSLMMDYQQIGQLIAAKEVELYKRQQAIQSETYDNDVAKHVRVEIAQRLGLAADRIVRLKKGASL